MAVGTEWRRDFSLAHISDDRLAVLAQGGNRRAMEQLLYRYRPVAEARADDYFWAGADGEDVIQEGMIGLYKAVQDYSQKANISFQSFARLCICRQIITALKAATRHKHAMLNCSASIAQPIGPDELTVLRDVIAGSEATNPERIIIGRGDVGKHLPVGRTGPVSPGVAGSGQLYRRTAVSGHRRPAWLQRQAD